MQTRSQTRENKEDAQKHIDNYLATSMKAKKVAAKKVVLETPQKQPDAIEAIQVNAPIKKARTENPSTAQINNGYRTRLSTGTIERKNLTVEFDAAFFDDASKAWNENKKKIGNGMYTYIITTRSNSKSQKN